MIMRGLPWSTEDRLLKGTVEGLPQGVDDPLRRRIMEGSPQEKSCAATGDQRGDHSVIYQAEDETRRYGTGQKGIRHRVMKQHKQ